MHRLWTGASVTALTALALWAQPAVARSGPQDAFLRAPANRELPNAAVSQVLQRGLEIRSIEGRLGVPTFVFNPRAASGAAAPARALAPASADAAARAHLRDVASLYRLGRAEVDAAELLSLHQPAIGQSGPVVARFGRRINGVEVFRSELKVVMDAGLQLVALSGYLAPPTADEARAAQAAAFRLSAPDAIAIATRELTGTALQARALKPAGSAGDYRSYEVDAALAPALHFASAPRAKRVLWAMPDTHVPAWYVEVNVSAREAEGSEAHYVAYVVNAADGAVLLRNELSAEEAFTYRLWVNADGIPQDGPQGNGGTPHPTSTPNGFQAHFVASSMVTTQNFPFSRNDPWLPSDATRTLGNNAEAYADRGGGDGFQSDFDHHAPTTGPRTFDYVFDPTRDPTSDATQRNAAIVNLFYVANFLHDWFYDVGFDEAAGNAQASNYGRGGLEGDSLRLEAQDYGGRNNANMSTPADGARPRMQQYIFDGVAELTVTAPAPLSGIKDASEAVFNQPAYDVTGDLMIPPTDADATVTQAYRVGCADAAGASPYTGTPFAGKIALIERGVCGFAYKVLNAQNAGAIAVVIHNNVPAAPLLNMAASGVPAIDSLLQAPAMFISQENGTALRTTAEAGTVSLRLRSTADLDRDGTMDNGIIAHEWGHYLSNRLVGNGNGLSSHQARSLGEGWSDFVALLMVVRAEDINIPSNANWNGTFSVAGYTQSGGANQGYYWGIRRVPYSSNMSANGLTLRHMANGTPLPGHPLAFGADGASNSALHNTGEVWATMLWESYASLLRAHPFQEAQDRMKRYLVAALKATPLQPTILEARDALLAVAAANDPADHARFVHAFAKRGAGVGAKVADRASQDHIGVVESFQTGNVVEVVSLTLNDGEAGCDLDGVLDAGETGRLSLTLRNAGTTQISGLTATLTAASVATDAGATLGQPTGNIFTFGQVAAGETKTVSLPITLSATTGIAKLDFSVALSVPHQGGTGAVSRSIFANYDEAPATSATETFDTVHTPWTRAHGGAGKIWSVRDESGERFMHVDNPDGSMESHLTSPTITAATGAAFAVMVQHRYSFEAADNLSAFYDGGVIELSIDGGPWTDIWELNWYSGTTANGGYRAPLASGNPIGARPAYAGLSPGYPAFQPVLINFGREFEGRQVQFRFRVGADEAVGAYGWDIAQVQVFGAAAPPFPSRVAEAAGAVCNQRPIANAGLNSGGVERDGSGALRTFKLSGGASLDPDASGPLTYQWTQRAGPVVVLDDATAMEPTFVADVPRDAVLTFELVVHDTIENSLPSQVQVAITNSNRAPVAVATVKDNGPTTIDERSGSVTLDGTASSDADNEPLNFTWVQTAGLPVELDDPSSATPTFTPPEVNADTAFTFALTVDDGEDASDEATVTVTVRSVDRAPIADAGASLMVRPDSTVQLAGSVVDPDGDAITSVAWTQTSGPAVTLDAADGTSPSFTAPQVSERVVLGFSLVGVANGVESNVATVEVTVAGENAAPILTGATQVSAAAGSKVTLTVAGHDPDGDALTYAWRHVSGPSAPLANSTTGALSFVAPNNAEVSAMVFEVVASDGLATSTPHQVTVVVSAQEAGGGCSATGNGAAGTLLPGLGLMAALMLMRRRRMS